MKPRDIILAALTALFMLGFALQPAVALQGAREGLELFLTVVLPSMLPFMVCACLFIASGAAGAGGRALNGLMRPLFACPGVSGFALAVSVLSGYPTGARVTSELYEAGLVSRGDAFRTGALASSTGPVFMLGALGAGRLGSPTAGWLILLSHYGAVLIAGLVHSLGGDRHSAVGVQPAAHADYRVMEAVGDAIKKTVETLWTVGGYIILFSVLTGLLRQYGVLRALAVPLEPLLRLLGLDARLAEPALVGMLEMSNGCNAVALCGAPLTQRCILLAALVSFGGLCVQAQSMLFLSRCGVGAGRFALAKLVQAAVAGCLCAALATVPFFNQALCMAGTAGTGFSPASALVFSTQGAAAVALVFVALAFVSARASTPGSAG